MTEEAEEGVDLSPTSGYEQQAPHFLQDVIFHGKFKVSSLEGTNSGDWDWQQGSKRRVTKG